MDERHEDPVEQARAELEAAQDKDDAARLEALESIHRSLEQEVEQADPAGR